MSAPQFDDFGTNTYRHKVVQTNGVVTISVRTWMSALFFLVIGLVAGGISVTTIVNKGKVVLSGGVLIAYAATVIGFVVAFLYGTYKEAITFDFDSQTYRIAKGFFWNPKDIRGTFEDIEAVTVRTARTETNTRRLHIAYDIGLECRTENPTFDLWQTSTEEQAKYISDTLANAFGCEIRYEGSTSLGGLRHIRNRL